MTGRWHSRRGLPPRSEGGFTLVELLVAVALFAGVSTGFYFVLFSVASTSDETRSVVRVSDEARLGLNRMIRDTREGADLRSAGPFSYTVEVDFDADGSIAPAGTTNSAGDYEVLTFAFSEAASRITLNNQVLVRRMDCIRDGGGNCEPVFEYSSNRLEYDWNTDAVTSWQELNDAPSHGVVGVGDGDSPPVLDAAEESHITNVSYAFRVLDGDVTETFRSEAQMRNRR